ncbi:hypothetical protein PITC_001080 [Penicillium italicum]|uniref:Protein kinase domain-containing protein n=1 Tax=Penicillium italicum TaxID=40296 RepID=A0A0A2LF90_PENIT|nr:hypothetical protein PITC_001080 [Penicillium italicum]
MVVWLARDTHANRYVALKVNIADSSLRETSILKALSAPPSSSSLAHPGYGLVPHLLDEFKVDGPNGTHTCYTVAPAQSNLRDVSFSRLFPLDVARALSYRLVQAVAYVHSEGYAHGDIHLRNILVRLPLTFDDLSVKELYKKYGEPETVPISRCDGQPLTPNVPAEAVKELWLGKHAKDFTLSDTHLTLSDFGEAFSPAFQTKLGRQCCTPFAFRAPEATFEPEAPLSYPSDIWSLATAIWDIVGMQSIFSTDSWEEDDVLSQHIDVLGPMPSDWWQRWEGKLKFFDESGHSTEYHKKNKWYPLDQSFETQVQKWRRGVADEMQDDEKTAFLNMMRQMLMFRPEERLTVKQVLESAWMVKWALPEYQRS